MKVSVKVKVKKQSIKSIIVAKGRKLSIKWAKDKMASEYQVQVSMDKNFKKGIKSKNLSKLTYTFTKPKVGENTA